MVILRAAGAKPHNGCPISGAHFAREVGILIGHHEERPFKLCDSLLKSGALAPVVVFVSALTIARSFYNLFR